MSAAGSTGAIAGKVAAFGAAERSVKLLMVEIGRMWWVGGVDAIDMATMFVMGHAVNSVPSSVG